MKTNTVAPTQGVMTIEAGAITGDVEIATEDNSEGVAVTIAYEGARDVYTVEGSPAPAGTTHEQIVTELTSDSTKATRLH